MISRVRMASGIVFIFIIVTVISDFSFSATSSEKTKPGSGKKSIQTKFNILETSHAFTQIVKKITPTVVSVHSTMIIRAKDLWRQRFNDDKLKDFLSEGYHNFSLPKEFRQRGSGSGIIVSEKGHILTNFHVIEKAEIIKVTLCDKRTFTAELVGIDPLTEVAVIKIEGDNLPVAALGNSDSCEIGEWVLAIGNPLELNSTVTAGIISAKGRDINIIRDTYGVENFIQTDAAINPGNSGGPIVNLRGEVIGVTTAIATESGFNQGYGFAIPINLAKEIMDDLIRKGRVVRGYLGISMQDIDEKKARALGLKKPIGVFIDSVSEDGPALKAGLKAKDVLVKINSEKVNSTNIVQSIIAKNNPGDEIILTIIRKNNLLKLKVLLGERQNTIISSPAITNNIKYRFLGLDVESLKKYSEDDIGFRSDYGVIVTAVELFSPASEAGIQKGDIIQEIGEIKITSIEIFQLIMDSVKSTEVIIIKILRADTTFHSFVEVP